MARQVLFVQSAGSLAEGSGPLVAYLQSELGAGFDVRAPEMPDPDAPHYATWRAKLHGEIHALDDDLILIGHSLGGSVILKYLAEGVCTRRIAALFLVSVPFWRSRGWDVDEFVLPTDFASKLPPISRVFLVHARDDETVPFAHHERYRRELPTATVRVLERSDHAFQSGLPELVDDLRAVTRA